MRNENPKTTALTGFWAPGFLLLVAAQPMRWTVLFDFWESRKGAHTLQVWPQTNSCPGTGGKAGGTLEA